METYIAVSIILIAIYLDGLAIYYAHKSDMYSPQQLTLQLLFVLLVPILGAILVISLSAAYFQDNVSSKEKPRGHLLKLLTLSFILTPSEHSDGNGDVDASANTGSNGDASE